MSRMHEEAKTGFLATFRPLLDDRRRPARRIRRTDITRAARSEHIAIRPIAARLKHAIKSESRRVTPDRIALAMAAFVVVMFGSTVLNMFLLPMIGASGLGLGLLVFIGLVVAAHFGIAWFVRRGTLNQLARTAVAEGVCGSCAFPLEHAPVEDDGCVVCPECGAAWKHERIVEPFWKNTRRATLRQGLRYAITPGVLPTTSLYAPDDRGRFVQTPDARLMRLTPEIRETIPDREFRRIRRDTRGVGLVLRWLLTVVLAGFPALTMWGAVGLAADGEKSGFWVMTIMAVVFSIPVAIIPFSAAFSTPHRTSRRIVRNGRCGSCMAPLNDAPTDDAGRSICAVCGSGWLADRIDSAPPPPPPVPSASA